MNASVRRNCIGQRTKWSAKYGLIHRDAQLPMRESSPSIVSDVCQT